MECREKIIRTTRQVLGRASNRACPAGFACPAVRSSTTSSPTAAATHPSPRDSRQLQLCNEHSLLATRRSTNLLTLSIRRTPLKGNWHVGCASFVNSLQQSTVNSICYENSVCFCFEHVKTRSMKFEVPTRTVLQISLISFINLNTSN